MCVCVCVCLCAYMCVWVCLPQHEDGLRGVKLNNSTVPPGMQAGEEPGKRARCVQHGVPEECGPEGMEQHPGYT